jgi:hypothetical protein
MLRAAGLLLALLAASAAAGEISGGELRFLATPPEPPPHHHSKHLILRPDSLASGWVEDRQCHERLDPVNAMQIMFGPGRVRRLRITRAERIGEARIDGNSVQLRQVGENARLCLTAETRLLEYDPLLRQYTLTSGPYLRRFLDGYFPLQLSVEIDYPADRLKLVDIQPPELRAGSRSSPGRLHLESLFEGRLVLVLHFAPLTPP